MTSGFAAAVESGSPDAIADVLHPDVQFSSPAVFTPYSGRDATLRVLRAFTSVVDGFHYVSTFRADNGDEVLRFAARVNGLEISGVDIVSTDDAGLVTELTVMIRPLKGLLAVVERMAVALA